MAVVLFDIILISAFLAQDSDHVKRWKTAFETSYGIPFSSPAADSQRSPEEAPKLNRCASVLKMASWSKKADHGDKIKDRANTISSFMSERI